MKYLITAVAAFVATSSVVSGMEAPELRGPVLVRLFYSLMLLNFIAIEHMICSYYDMYLNVHLYLYTYSLFFIVCIQMIVI